ncbi:hypothetical protein NX786_25900 [Telluria mixta]|uniref:HNH endonuclease n=1 Tax=Telluria mixta TaxID=34071 RepID=A0ABT2C5V1_9BURK|nr:hypothetical protein [Telluria mixta]MCS0632771.1 hypothetical protein [Telluria mixta]WEM97848.1 hypothetical protein P0M04_09050 [Telluria mixta]
MLHERRLPEDLAQDLGRVYSAKMRLLNWLLRSPPQALDDNTQLVQQFGKALGKWLWARIRKPKTRTAFGTAVMALATKARGDPAQAVLVADAITQDAQFHQRWNIAGNELLFPRLHPNWLESVKDVAVPFYDWLGGMGFEPGPFSLTGDRIDRATVMKAFRRHSHDVCGYCDGPLGELGSASEANDCDHFFPKSQWPHLAIHPANLFSACQGCNSRWKLDKVPMGDADAQGLNNTYHPMLRPGASVVVVKATVSAASARQVEIKITDPSLPRRAETLVATLDLESRWTNWVNKKLDPSVSVFVSKSIRDRGLGQQPTPESVRELIEDDIAWKRGRLGKEERCIREIAVLKCMRDDILDEVIADLT